MRRTKVFKPVYRERQDVRQKIIDEQVERLRKIKNKEDEILNKHVIIASRLGGVNAMYFRLKKRRLKLKSMREL